MKGSNSIPMKGVTFQWNEYSSIIFSVSKMVTIESCTSNYQTLSIIDGEINTREQPSHFPQSGKHCAMKRGIIMVCTICNLWGWRDLPMVIQTCQVKVMTDWRILVEEWEEMVVTGSQHPYTFSIQKFTLRLEVWKEKSKWRGLSEKTVWMRNLKRESWYKTWVAPTDSTAKVMKPVRLPSLFLSLSLSSSFFSFLSFSCSDVQWHEVSIFVLVLLSLSLSSLILVQRLLITSQNGKAHEHLSCH